MRFFIYTNMKIKLKLIFLILILYPIILLSQPVSIKDYPLNENGCPTTIGIEQYVKDNEEKVIEDFENYYGVKIQQMYFETDNLQDYGKDNYLGIFLSGMNLAIISNEEKYQGYSAENLSKRKLQKIKENNFVISAMMHEMCHNYIYETIINAPSVDARDDKAKSFSKSDISREFLVNTNKSTFGSVFIEEGICEYGSMKISGFNISKNFVPKTYDELIDSANLYKIKYKYSVYFVKNILDKHGFIDGITLILKNSPPTNEELLEPKKYYNRLK